MPGGGAASRAPSIPRCGVSSPFRGHLSTKSNAFSIGHSSRLSDQYRIRDHMLAHYNKILTAKAAVDCSVPKSLTKSIKYNDQQRRERLKMVVSRIEHDSLPSRASSSRPNSRESLNSTLQRKDQYDGYVNTFRHSPYSDPGASPTSFISSTRLFHFPEGSVDRRRHPEHSDSPSRAVHGLTGSSVWGFAARRFQDNREKAYSGDLIEKHAHYFTGQQHPFTPRTLKTPAKSALAQSRFYTAPGRKRRERVSEVGVQTDISSFRGQKRVTDRTVPLDETQVEDPENSILSEEEVDNDRQGLSTSRMSYNELQSPSPTIQRIRSEEEELAYLEFVADVTNEILSLGLFSDRILDRVFERHLKENRHCLDEGKMRHLLNILRADLDSKDEKKLDLFSDHDFSTNRHFRDPLMLTHEIKNDGFCPQDFYVDNYKSNLRYLDGKYDKTPLQDNVRNGLDGEDNLGSGGFLTCLDKRDLDLNNVANGQVDFQITQQSSKAVISLPELELDTSQQKDDVLCFQDDHEETYSNTQLLTVDDDLSEHHNGNHRGLGLPELDHDLKLQMDLPQLDHDLKLQMDLPELNHDLKLQMDLPQLDHDLKNAHEPRDLVDLEHRFSEVVQVSEAEDSSSHKEEVENAPSNREAISDQDDF